MAKQVFNSTILIATLLVSIFLNGCNQSSNEFHIKYSNEVSSTPLDGRIMLILSKDTLIDPDIPNPMRPFITFGMNFKNWKPGEKLILNGENSESFIANLDELDGNYSLRAIVDLDTTSCLYYIDGICYSDKIVFNAVPEETNIIEVKVGSVLSGFGFNESENIKLLKHKSNLLSDFYKTPTYIEAAVILPDSYNNNPDKYYPTVFVMPGWGSNHVSASNDTFQQKKYGMSGFGEEKIYVFLNQDCRYGYHVFADSDNNGPRGESFITELIPHLEKEYRVIKEANTRFLIGQSSGAWAALWLQINYPDHFGMAWAGSPDPVDFRDFCGNNLYMKDANIFYDANGKPKSSFRSEGNIFTVKDWSDLETVLGEGGQYQSFEAVFGKKDKNGIPQQFFDRKTGKVHKEIIEHWKKYDLNLIIQNNADKLKPKLNNKINIVVADNDDFYLDGAVKLIKTTFEKNDIKANIKLLTDGGHNTWTDETRTEMHQKMDDIYLKAIKK
ncbi:alpha/beta hydrolase-fold protein [Bacteroidota bacterium]